MRGLQVADAAVLDVRDRGGGRARARAGRSGGRCASAPPARAARSPLVLGEHALGDLARLLGLVAAEHELRPARRRRVALRSRLGCASLGLRGDARSRRRGSAGSSGSSARASPRSRPGTAPGSRGCARRWRRGSRRSPAGRRRRRSGRGCRGAAPATIVDLERVDVLVLVDEHVVEHRRELRAGGLVRGERAPVEQKVVEVEHLRVALALAVARGRSADLVRGRARTRGTARPAPPTSGAASSRCASRCRRACPCAGSACGTRRSRAPGGRDRAGRRCRRRRARSDRGGSPSGSA